MITLKQTLFDIKNDLPREHKGFTGFIISYFYNPCFRILLNHRLGKFFYKRNSFFLRQIGSYYRIKLLTKRGCDISYNAHIGKRLNMPHPIGIVIGDGVVIEDDVKVFQQVTLGSHGKRDRNKMEYPIIKSRAKIFAGAIIIGGITIGEDALIGANSVVNIDVPFNCVAAGVPCKIYNRR